MAVGEVNRELLDKTDAQLGEDIVRTAEILRQVEYNGPGTKFATYLESRPRARALGQTLFALNREAAARRRPDLIVWPGEAKGSVDPLQEIKGDIAHAQKMVADGSWVAWHSHVAARLEELLQFRATIHRQELTAEDVQAALIETSWSAASSTTKIAFEAGMHAGFALRGQQIDPQPTTNETSEK